MIVAIFTLQDFLAIFTGPRLTIQLGRIFLRLLLETGPPFYVIVLAKRISNRWLAKAVSLFLSYFKTLSIGTNPEVEPLTSPSEVKRSTN